jgi:hydantoinase/carbamoylase family amidase
MLDLLKQLRELSATEVGCTRIGYTDLEDQAFDLVWRNLSDIAHLKRVDDAAGNMFIVPERSAMPDADPVVLVGSHLDTVVEGGWLDGALGVAVAANTLRIMAENETARPSVGLVVFRDEEGVRFNTGLFGSRVFANRCRQQDLDVADVNGIRVGDVVPDPVGCLDYVPPVKPACFLECHIEQGVRMAASGDRVGLVDGVVGIRRYRLEATGAANHAGTTDMRRRRDALVPVARIVSQLPALVSPWEHAVLTCGQLMVLPGAPNVVPGKVIAVVESRAPTVEILDDIERSLQAYVHPQGGSGEPPQVTLALTCTLALEPTATDNELLSRLRLVVVRRGIQHLTLPSMAGHDTQNATRVCPSAMFFIPSIDGISHNPEEDSHEADIRLAGEVMHEWVLQCLRQ